jgi:cytochrome c oxidase accessory protein FixG
VKDRAAGPAELIVTEDVVSTRQQRAVQSLYVSRIKVYPKAVSGLFRRLKWALLVLFLGVYYLLPWLRWDRGPGAPDQAVLIDMPGRRAYFFMIEIWPQEIYFLAGLLILAAFGLFLVTTMLGRVWCGYACPQTVWTDLFLWVEALIEGDRNSRMKLDQGPLTVAKAAKKTLKHAAWLAIAALTGGAWVFYFSDAPGTLADLWRMQASAPVYLFIGLFTATTYLLAGWAREQVCTYMCPWPRFQAALQDEHTFLVTYRAWRGEPRGKHKRGQSWEGRGDCVDCNACVSVCPTGIDIRDGQQLECIGCGLCIDACNAVMRKVERPLQLIAWDTMARQGEGGTGPVLPLWRPRMVLYGLLMLAVAGVMLFALLSRASAELNVQRDRNPLFVRLSDGAVRNGYTVNILNKRRDEVPYRLSISGLSGATMSVAETGAREVPASSHVVLPGKPDAVSTYRLFVTLPAGAGAPGANPIKLLLADETGGQVAHYDAAFLVPTEKRAP